MGQDARCCGWALVLATLLTSCYAPTVREEVPCGADGACPGTQTCDRDGVCRSELLPDAPRDEDGDSVSDDDDNCPTVANTAQYDEDADGVGNVCDNCPHVANPQQEATTDTDMVGDMCDFAPTSSNERLVMFQGFDQRPDDWTLEQNVKVMNGQLVITADSLSTVRTAYWNPPAPAVVAVVIAGEVAVASQPGTKLPTLSLLAHVKGTTEHYRCGVLATRLEAVRQASTMSTVLISQAHTNTWGAVGLAIAVFGTQVGCTFVGGGVPAEQVTGQDQLVPLTGTTLGVRLREANAHIDYVVVYTIDSP